MKTGVNVSFRIPIWLDRIFVWPVLLYRRLQFGYSFRKIPLGEGRFTIVDLRDFYRFNFFHWTLDGKKESIYAVRNIIPSVGKSRIVRMHREIMHAPPGLFVDHRNNNGLDNRRANLRLATHSQNMQNRAKTRLKTSSRFIGVYLDNMTGRWKTQINHQRKPIYLGRFDNEIDAAKVYDRAAIKYHGEFARLNFPREDYNVEIRNTHNA
jgi:hypothetical protein